MPCSGLRHSQTQVAYTHGDTHGDTHSEGLRIKLSNRMLVLLRFFIWCIPYMWKSHIKHTHTYVLHNMHAQVSKQFVRMWWFGWGMPSIGSGIENLVSSWWPCLGGGAASQEDALTGREHLRVHSQATPAVTLSASFLSAGVWSLILPLLPCLPPQWT